MCLHQSLRVNWSSPGLNHRTVAEVSLLELASPAVLLERRFRSFSVVESADTLTTSVGNTWPCFRCATICTEHSFIELAAYCIIGSESCYRATKSERMPSVQFKQKRQPASSPYPALINGEKGWLRLPTRQGSWSGSAGRLQPARIRRLTCMTVLLRFR